MDALALATFLAGHDYYIEVEQIYKKVVFLHKQSLYYLGESKVSRLKSKPPSIT